MTLKEAIKTIRKWRKGFELLSESAKTTKESIEYDQLLDAIDTLLANLRGGKK